MFNSILKNIADHPLIAVILSLLPIGAIIFGVSDYYHNRTVDRIRDRYQLRIDDLSAQLRSIDRGVSFEDKFIDVKEFSIGDEDVPKLSAKHKEFLDGAFYAVPPGLEYVKVANPATAIEFREMYYGAGLSKYQLGNMRKKAIQEMYRALYSEQTWVIWSDNETSFKVYTGKGRSNVLRPFFAVTKIDEEMLLGRVAKNFDMLCSQESGSLRDMESDRYTRIKSVSSTNTSEAQLESDKEDQRHFGTLDCIPAHFFQDVMRYMELAISEDVASYVLMNQILNLQIRFLDTRNVIFRISSLQKKGRVFYVRTQTRFLENTKNEKDVVLDEESFFIRGDAGWVYVRIGVPSFDMRGRAYDWTSELLLSLRVPR